MMRMTKPDSATLFTLFGGILITLLACKTDRPNWDWVEELPKPWTLTEAEITRLLPGFHKRYPHFEDRLKALALWRVGTPYEIFMLGEEIPPDPDPIIRMDVSDCTGHILTTLSLGQSRSWQEARERMIAIHYKDGTAGEPEVSYTLRWHFTTDRLLNNPSTVNISESLVPAENLEWVDMDLNRKEDGKELLELAWEYPVHVGYIPNSQINAALLRQLPDVCGVAFVRPDWFKNGLIVGHEGMIIDRKDLIHASQSQGETVRQDFLDYYFDSKGESVFGGVLIYAFRPLDSGS